MRDWLSMLGPPPSPDGSHPVSSGSVELYGKENSTRYHKATKLLFEVRGASDFALREHQQGNLSSADLDRLESSIIELCGLLRGSGMPAPAGVSPVVARMLS